MKLYHLLLGAALCSTVSSCFKDEPLNAECDIEQAYVHLDTPTDVFFAESDTLINVLSGSDNIVFEVKDGVDLSQMAPMFRLTEGATVSLQGDKSLQDANGSVHDFSDGKVVTYVVTSQDGKWTRTYNVSFLVPETPDEYDFENFRLVKGPNQGQMYEWYDLTDKGYTIADWATGNGGFNICMGNAQPEEYPSVPVADGYKGHAVKLTTLDTGPLGHLQGMRIAAGNLFIGFFNTDIALKDAMGATNFGRSFDREPISFTGWYKYSPGKTFQDENGKPVSGRTDVGDIYAVLYYNHDDNGDAFMLHGDDVLTSKYIVAIARVPEVKTTDNWTEFTVDFDYRQQLDRDLLRNRGYNLAVVFTSSLEGASFKGAIGSTLYVDEVKVICAD